MSHIAQNETHRNQQSLAARSIAREHHVFAKSSLVEDITAQRASEDYLRHLAATDTLTGLANYRTLSETLESEIKRSDRTGRAFAVLLFDLNGMKRINETHGPLEGDRALCRLAELFHFSCRSIDTVAR